MITQPHVVQSIQFVGRGHLSIGVPPTTAPTLSVKLDTAQGICLDLVLRVAEARQLQEALGSTLQALDFP